VPIAILDDERANAGWLQAKAEAAADGAPDQKSLFLTYNLTDSVNRHLGAVKYACWRSHRLKVMRGACTRILQEGSAFGGVHARERRSDVQGATMVKFDDLPHSSQTLMLATLQLEIAEAKCANILDLSRTRHKAIQDVWRDICRKTGQPRCTVPPAVMAPRDQGLESVTAGHVDATTAARLVESPRLTSSDPLTATPAPSGSSANNGAMTAPAKTALASTPGGHRARSLRAPMVVGLVAVLALGVGLVVLLGGPQSTVAPQTSLQIPGARPTDVVRDGTIIRDRSKDSASSGQTDRTAGRTAPEDKPEFDPNSVPPPQGTIRRLEAISKSFSKR
jgi:hypothetical protein